MKYYKQIVRNMAILICMLFLTTTYAQTYKIDTSNSKIIVEGTSNLRDWSAQVGDFSGTMEVDDAGNPTKVMLTMKVLSMDGGRGADMNAKIYKALKSDDYPQITFQSTSIDAGSMVATGTLSMAGQTREVSVAGELDLGSAKLTTTKDLKLSDFEIEPPSALFGQIKCKDEIKVMFDIALKAQ